MEFSTPTNQNGHQQFLNNESQEDQQNRLSLSNISDEKYSVPDLKKKLKLLKNAIIQERQEFVEYKAETTKTINLLKSTLNQEQQQSLESSLKFDDFQKLPQSNSLMNPSESTMTPSKSMLSSSNIGTEKMLSGVQHYLNSGMAKFYKSPENLVEENGEIYDFFYSLKQIKILKEKVEKKSKQYEEVKQKLQQREEDLENLRNQQQSNGKLIYGQDQLPRISEQLDENKESVMYDTNKLYQDIETLTQQLLNSQQKNQELDNMVTSLESQIKLLNQDIEAQNFKEESLLAQIKTLEQEKQDFNEVKENLTKEIQKAQNQAEEIQSLNQQQQSSQDSYAQQLNYAGLLEQNIARLNGQIKDLKDSVRKEKSKYEELENEGRLQQLQIEQRDTTISILENKLNDKEQENIELKNSLQLIEIQKKVTPISNQNQEDQRILKTETYDNQEVQNIFEKSNIFLRINSFGQYVLQYETQKENILINGEDIVNIKLYDEDLKRNEFYMLYQDNLQKKKQTKVIFKCQNQDEFATITTQLINFMKEARLDFMDRQNFIKENEERRQQENGQFMKGIFNFFGSAKKEQQ